MIGADIDKRKYRCNFKSGNWVSLSGDASQTLGQNCKVTYNTETKPSTPVVINMDYTADGGKTWTSIDSYTIKVPTNWAVIKKEKARYNTGNNYSGSYEAAQLCGAPPMTGLTASNINTAASYFFKRNEVSNPPQIERNGVAIYQDGKGWTRSFREEGGYFSRDVDGTFAGEWGIFSDYLSLPHTTLWLGEAAHSVGEYSLDSSTGAIMWYTIYYRGNEFGLMCRG